MLLGANWVLHLFVSKTGQNQKHKIKPENGKVFMLQLAARVTIACEPERVRAARVTIACTSME